MNQAGIAIISLTAIYRKKDKTQQLYYLLTYQLQRKLATKYFQLTEPKETLKSNRQPLFLFNAKKQFAPSLIPNNIYWIAYTICQKKPKNYLHLQDWRILGDQKTLQRTLNLLLTNPHEKP